MSRRRRTRPGWAAAALTGAAVVSVSLTACEGTPAASQVTVIAGSEHLTFSPAPDPGSTQPPDTQAAVTFAAAPAGGSETQSIELQAGDAAVTIASIELKDITGAREFTVVSDDCSEKKLEPRQRCSVVVQFSPNSTSAQDAALTFNLGESTPPLRLELRGEGTGVVSPPSAPTLGPSPSPTKTTPSPSPTGSTGKVPVPAPTGTWIFRK